MTDIGPIPPKDQTNYLLGRLEGTMSALKDTVVASAAAQAIANTQHEAEHAEFRKTLTEHSSEIAVLKDNKVAGRNARSDAWLKWSVILGIPAAVIASVGGLLWLLTNHP